MIRLKFFFLAFFGCFLLAAMPLHAGSAPADSSKLDLGALGPSTGKPVKKNVEHTYTQITYDNLYRLAWSYGAYGPDDIDALNIYLMVTECNLYKKFFANEFEWEKIRIATRDYLKNNKTKVPRYYEYVQPIFLGRYDYSLQGFPIIDAESFKGQKNFQFASFRGGSTLCGVFSFDFARYPSTGVLTVDSPMNFSFVRVPLKLAQKYVEWRAKQGLGDADNRQAYIRYRIRVDDYNGIRTFEGFNAFNFSGRLLRIDVFADQDLLLPLYNQLF